MSKKKRRVEFCERCGSKLPSINTTGRCYRPCQSKVELTAPKRVIARNTAQWAIETHYGMTLQEIFVLGKGNDPLAKKRKTAIYLFIHDCQMGPHPVGTLVDRDQTAVISIINSAERIINELSDDIVAIRKLYGAGS